MVGLGIGAHEELGIDADDGQTIDDEAKGGDACERNLVFVDVTEDEVFADKGWGDRETREA